MKSSWQTVLLAAIAVVAVAMSTVVFAQPAPMASEAPAPADQQRPKPNALVQQPRAFGYVLGDVVTQRVLLEQNGHEFTAAELPTPGPAGNWVERRAVRLERDTRGHRWLAVDYQVMNSPQTLMAVTLPAWKLSAKSGDGELRVSEWSITVAPLTPRQPIARMGLGDLRPDRNASPVEVAPMKRGIAVSLTALIVLPAVWIGWWAWRNWRASSAQPFARALRELRGVGEDTPQAWHALHRAFDGTAGKVVQSEALSPLFERAPQFEPQRRAIEAFFAESAERFFGTGAGAGTRTATGASLSARTVSLRALCADLRRIEKRHEP